jgi:hypothetical protein
MTLDKTMTERKHLTGLEIERLLSATKSKVLHVERLKGGLPTPQPLRTEEIRALKRGCRNGRK